MKYIVVAALAALMTIAGSPAMAEGSECPLMASDQTFTLKQLGMKEGTVPVNLAAGLHSHPRYRERIHATCSVEQVEAGLLKVNGWQRTSVVNLDEPFRLPVAPPVTPAQATPETRSAAPVAVAASPAEVATIQADLARMKERLAGLSTSPADELRRTVLQPAIAELERKLALKADKTWVQQQLTPKADKTWVEGEFLDGEKFKAKVESLIANAGASFGESLGLKTGDKVATKAEMAAVAGRVSTLEENAVPWWLVWGAFVLSVIAILIAIFKRPKGLQAEELQTVLDGFDRSLKASPLKVVSVPRDKVAA